MPLPEWDKVFIEDSAGNIVATAWRSYPLERAQVKALFAEPTGG
jgi:hypothetical protein